MNVQIIERQNQPEYAVLPYEEYVRLAGLAEDAEDLMAANKSMSELKAGADEAIPSEMVYRLCDGANPVAEWRKHRGMTQAVLAEIVGVSQAAVATIEKGKRAPSVSLLRKLADALGVDLDDLA